MVQVALDQFVRCIPSTHPHRHRHRYRHRHSLSSNLLRPRIQYGVFIVRGS